MKRLIICIFCLCAVQAHAEEGHGRLGTEFYLYEQDTTSHAKFYQSLNLSKSLYKNNLKSISLKTYGRYRTDLSNQEQYVPQLYLYDAYLNFKNYLPDSKIKLGRQFVYSPVGSAILDGVSSDIFLMDKLQVKLSAGSYVDRATPDKLQNLSENLTSVSRIGYNFGKFKSGLNYVYKKRYDDVESHKAGIDVSVYRSKYSAYARGTYDIYLNQLYELLLRTSLRVDKYYFSVEYLNRKPSVSPNSVFAIIDADEYRKIRVDLQRTLTKKLKLITEYQVSLFEDENISSGYAGVSHAHFSLMYNFQKGRGTNNSGFSGTVSHKFSKVYSVYGMMNLNKYKIQDEVEETSESYTTAFGIARPIGVTMYLRLEYQYLRNAVESSNQRVYLKFNKQFTW